MAYYSDTWTDKMLRTLEKRLVSIYKQASEEMLDKLDKYLSGYDETIGSKTIHHKGFAERYLDEFNAYKRGVYTKQQFDSWVHSQIGREEWISTMLDEMSARLTNANVIASDYINNMLPEVFAENANYESFLIENAGFKANFALVDEATVKQLTRYKQILPKMDIDLTKDQLWNHKHLQRELLQGILQGESIPKIADRFQRVSDMNRASAIRNARTATTSAENSGRQETYQNAENMGIELQKEWISTYDDRTRESHVELNGVRVKQDKRFPNGLMFPADPVGKPEEVYNCRCTMRAILPAYNGADRTGKSVASYRLWQAKKVAEKAMWWTK